MNYHEARQLGPHHERAGKWDWTTMNDGQIWTAGACRNHEPGGHDTREEAERHFYDGEVAELTEYSILDAQHPCAVCKAWTSKGLRAHLIGDELLCDEHRNAEGFQQANPFHPGLSITASW